MSENNTETFNLYYHHLDTDLLGCLWLAASDTGLTAVRFDQDSSQFLANLLLEIDLAIQPNIIHDQTRLQPYTHALTAYFTDKTPLSTDLPIDLTGQTAFQQDILTRVRRIPLGATVTYGDLADQINNPNAARAIGQVMRRNPIPVVIPCHRVMNADGTLGGYGGVMGSERKIALLKHEGVILA